MEKTAVIILGMHRSGTSAVAGVLDHLGISFGSSLMPPAVDNEKGYFENIDVYRIHEAVLAALGSTWDSVFPLPTEWWRSAELTPCKEQLRQFIVQEFSDRAVFAVKDPRLSRLLPMWRDILDDLGIRCRFILPIRHPVEVALSLAKRNGFSLEKGALIWADHNLEAERLTRHDPRLIVSYHAFLEKPERLIRIVTDQWRLGASPDATTMAEVRDFLEPALQHHRIEPAKQDRRLINFMFKLYRSLLDLSDWTDGLPSARAELDELAAELASMRDFFYTRDLRNDLTNASTAARKLDDLRERLQKSEDRLKNMEQQLLAAEQTIRLMEESWSWKLTETLRVANARLRALIR